MRFFLGTHHPHWLARTDLPLFVSARRLRDRVALPRALGPWALDSGGFSEIALYGAWRTPAMQYSSEVRHWRDGIGRLEWAAIQDWMCEPWMLARTGFTIREHQLRTVHSYSLLRQLAPDLPWMPVLQGWTIRDYLACIGLYERVGIDLASLPVVGLGSVCRRQGTFEAEEIVRELASTGIRLHLFGFKLRGLANVHHLIESSDSMAWSFTARREQPMAGHPHKSCANCLPYAQRWRSKVERILLRPAQAMMF